MIGRCPKCGYEAPPYASNRPWTATAGPIRDSGPKFAVGQYRGENEQAPRLNLHLFVDQRAIDLGPEFPVDVGHYPDVAITIEGTKLTYHVRNPDTGFKLTGELVYGPDEYTWYWPNAEARIAQEVSADQIGCRGLQMDIERAFELTETELTDFQWQPVK